MISSLRKRHRRTWLALAIVIPLFLIFARGTDSERPARAFGEQHFDVSAADGFLSVNIQSPLESALTEVFLSGASSCEAETYLGTIENMGSYRFDISSVVNPCEVILKDALNNKIVARMKLNP